MSCRDKISNRCGKRSSSVCVDYEGILRVGTGLDPNDCLSVQDVIEDINDGIDELKANTDLSALTSQCIDFNNGANPLTVSAAIIGLEQKLEEVMAFIGMKCDDCSGSPDCTDCPKIFSDNIACLNLDYGVLVDACGNQPANLQELLQIMLDNLQP
jgi:hypothetical protein